LQASILTAFFPFWPLLPVDMPRVGNLPFAPEFLRAGLLTRLLSRREGSEKRLTEIRLKKGESVEKALRRLKKKIDREGTLKVVRSHRHYEKPSERRRRKEKAARFSAMLSARYADM
jgi:small subunit ribosomal protein S21